MSLSGLVLAGGRSRRMGLDKALLVMDGERLVDKAVRRLAGICDEVLLAAGADRPLRILGVRQVADAVEGIGPLGGLLGGLDAAGHDLVAVLAVDHPDAKADVLERLAELWKGEAAIVPQVAGRPQPLHAVWARAAATELRALAGTEDHSLHQVFERLDVRLVGPEIWGDLDPTGSFARNVNRPTDLS